jgi:hypothetical protein
MSLPDSCRNGTDMQQELFFMGSDSEISEKDNKQTVKRAHKKKVVGKEMKDSAKTKGTKKKKAAYDNKSKATPKRVHRPYPMVAYQQATVIGDAIHRYASGESIRRLTLLEKLSLSETSSSTRQLITNSGKYGITVGSFNAEWIELTPLGKVVCDPDAKPTEKLRAQFTLAIENISPFKLLYDRNVGKKLVAREVMFDWFDEGDFSDIDKAECVDIFITNAKDLGLLRPIAGSETLIPIAQRIEELGPSTSGSFNEEDRTLGAGGEITADFNQVKTDWESTCFYVTPIGKPGSDVRKHSDLFKSSIVEPAMKELNLKVKRAEEIENPGMIGTGILEHIKRCKLVVADLSTMNPNVFYEIALRHACKLPIVQIIRQGDVLPFDIAQVNTITIDNTDLYTFVPQIPTFCAELTTLARAALDNPERISNPITAYYPSFWKGMPSQ